MLSRAYEVLIKNALTSAAEAEIRGRSRQAGSRSFARLGAELYRAIITATEDVLPDGYLESIADEVDAIAIGGFESERKATRIPATSCAPNPLPSPQGRIS